MNILHIDSSPRGQASHSRRMTAELVERLTQTHAGATVTYRDIGHNSPPHVDEAWTKAAYTPPAEQTPEQRAALKISDELVDELLAADIVVLGVPMYNFGVPSTFKAWIDQVARLYRTWTPAYEGLVKGKQVFVITSRGGGGYGPGEQMEKLNYQDPYIRTALGFVGMTDVNFVHINNTSKGEEAVRESVAGARETFRQTLAA